MPEENQTKTLNKEEILTTEARRALFNSLLQGYSVKQAAKQAGITYQYARRQATENNIHTLVRQEKEALEAKTAEKLEINAKKQFKKLQEIIDICMSQGKYRECLTAIADQNRLAGLYLEDNIQRHGDKMGLAEAVKGWFKANRKSIKSKAIEPDKLLPGCSSGCSDEDKS